MRPETRAALRGAAGAVGIWLVLLSPAAAQETPAGPDVPDTLRESYRDWVLRCAAGAGPGATPPRRCEIAQEVRTAETDQRVLRMALAGNDGAGAAVTLVTPFGVRVADGVGIATAGMDGTRIDFLTCLQGGCVATGTLDAAMLDALQAAETATVTMNSTGGETVTLDLSLAGFAAAWRRLGALAPD
ncbi:invasion associated locus B family protein [Meridianimarinicoccus sp. RP-17]|uniref:invasion associated locus B family protein n=1 Tax=Meridianimarinicoccus zhengii TaxID=2056810 RepID=UPI0013A6CA08|nr:invasion associated locus B family protein [Phycocomes zhengii]